MSRRALLGLVMVAAACGGGEDDAAGAGGSGGGGGDGINDQPPACIQMPKCAYGLEHHIDAICVEDECIDVGARGPDDQVQRASFYIFSRYPKEVTGYRIASVGVTMFHPTRPNGERLTCADLLALEPAKRRNAGYTNVVAWNSRNAADIGGNDTIPAPMSRIPVNEPGVEYVLLSELWSGPTDAASPHANTGAVIADGCVEGVVVEEGQYLLPDGSVDERFSTLIQTSWVESAK
ncbi:hypothetical protein [Vulgatibacter sp.]|uniref:hypothetical protein n=1 Tax=Vulgatibacter sp. TaxID=1971226 RepID=UPI0035650619